jgi:hypothetical protein
MEKQRSLRDRGFQRLTQDATLGAHWMGVGKHRTMSGNLRSHPSSRERKKGFGQGRVGHKFKLHQHRGKRDYPRCLISIVSY